MAKLATVKPRLGGLRHRIGASPQDEAERSRQRRETDPVFRQYGLASWKRLRRKILVRDGYTCAKCERLAIGKGQAIVDHKIPHRGDMKLFWDASNLQCLCKPCHDRLKQKEEQSAIKGVWY